MRPISAEEFWKMATGETGDGAVVKDKEHGKARPSEPSMEGLMGDAKEQDGTNKSLRKHVEPKGSQGHNTLRQDDAGLKSNDGKKEKSEGEGHLQDNESMGGESPKPKTATEAYLSAVFGMIKNAAGADLGMGGANALGAPQPLNVKQPVRLPNPGAQPPVQKN